MLANTWTYLSPRALRLRELLSQTATLVEERQLLREVFDIFLEPLERASERGVLVLNIGTVAALGAIARGECPDSRLVAVRGTAVGNPQLCRVRVGTPISVVLDALGIQGKRVEVYSGGAVMHERVISFDEPVCWSTTGLLVETKGMGFDTVAVQQPCIRCDACLPVCPEGLSPLKLLGYRLAMRSGGTGARVTLAIVHAVSRLRPRLSQSYPVSYGFCRGRWPDFNSS